MEIAFNVLKGVLALRVIVLVSQELLKDWTRELYTSRKQMTTSRREKKTGKLNTIKRDFFDTHNLKFNEKWFVNLTDVEFPIEYRWLLSLGGKFAIPTSHDNFPLLNIIVNVEECLRSFDDERTKEITRARITNILTNRKCKLAF